MILEFNWKISLVKETVCTALFLRIYSDYLWSFLGSGFAGSMFYSESSLVERKPCVVSINELREMVVLV